MINSEAIFLYDHIREFNARIILNVLNAKWRRRSPRTADINFVLKCVTSMAAHWPTFPLNRLYRPSAADSRGIDWLVRSSPPFCRVDKMAAIGCGARRAATRPQSIWKLSPSPIYNLIRALNILDTKWKSIVNRFIFFNGDSFERFR